MGAKRRSGGIESGLGSCGDRVRVKAKARVSARASANGRPWCGQLAMLASASDA